MNRKVTIIGAGSVGASIAYTAVVKGVALKCQARCLNQ